MGTSRVHVGVLTSSSGGCSVASVLKLCSTASGQVRLGRAQTSEYFASMNGFTHVTHVPTGHMMYLLTMSDGESRAAWAPRCSGGCRALVHVTPLTDRLTATSHQGRPWATPWRSFLTWQQHAGAHHSIRNRDVAVIGQGWLHHMLLLPYIALRVSEFLPPPSAANGAQCGHHGESLVVCVRMQDLQTALELVPRGVCSKCACP
jgi:hypothetical protein